MIPGYSGSGKSTIFYTNPKRARCILVDDKPLVAFDKTKLRKHVSFVTQEPQLILTTIASKIRYGMSEDTAAAVLDAASNSKQAV